MRDSQIQIEPLTSFVGAEIHSVDLREPLTDNVLGTIRDAFGQYGVVFFRDQPLTPEQHIAFAERFGPININRFFTPVPGYPSIAEVRKEPHNKDNIGGGWHTDHSYDRIPALGSALYAREVPNIWRRYVVRQHVCRVRCALRRVESHARNAARLPLQPPRLRRGGRTTQRDLQGRVGNPELATQDAVHPVVIRHPLTGRKALYVNPGFTLNFEGWTEQESEPLLDYLYQHAVRPEFTCRFRWQKESLALWDNRSTWHFAVNDYQGERRLMHRVTIEGTPLH